MHKTEVICEGVDICKGEGEAKRLAPLVILSLQILKFQDLFPNTVVLMQNIGEHLSLY